MTERMSPAYNVENIYCDEDYEAWKEYLAIITAFEPEEKKKQNELEIQIQNMAIEI